LSVGPVGFGAMVLSPGLYGPVDESEAEVALAHALDHGVTLVDTSDGYGPEFHNERLVGRVVRRRRGEVVVATKFGFRPPGGAGRHAFPVGYRYRELAVNADPRLVRGYAEGSLRRLGTEWIDVWFPHFPDPVIPIEDTVGAMAELVHAGLVRVIGLSNVTADLVERAQRVHPIGVVQVEWSMWQPIEPALLALARRDRIGIMAWGPLGAGFLAGTVTGLDPGDFRHNFPRYDQHNLAANDDRYAPIRALAAELGLSPSRLALAWLLHQHPAVVPIPGSRSPAHIDDNVAAADVVLDAETLARLDAEVARFRPLGATLWETAQPASAGEERGGS
jgi:aryl-alcohol dehydrogenase-like predicted oxidoreductase